jgi:comEA protein
MSSGGSSPTGSGLIAILLAAFIFWAWRVSLERNIKLTEVGPAIVAEKRADWPDMRVNINTAAQFELSILPGLGPSLAERIVEHRETNGDFTSIEELSNVNGIGSALIERMRPFIAIEASQPNPRAAADGETIISTDGFVTRRNP